MMESKKDILVQGPSRVFGITTLIIADSSMVIPEQYHANYRFIFNSERS